MSKRMNEILQRCGANLEKIHLCRKMSPSDICRAIEEANKRNPTLATIKCIADVLGVSAYRFLQ